MTDKELSQYYADLLILQYKSKNNAEAHTLAFVDQNVLLGLLRRIERGFNIDLDLNGIAYEKQLDMVGHYYGVARDVINANIQRDYFGSHDYEPHGGGEDKIPLGTLDYGDFSEQGDIFEYATDVSIVSLTSLTDEELYALILQRKFVNSSNMSLYEIDQYLDMFFKDNVIVNEVGLMVLEYVVNNKHLRNVGISDHQRAFPRPAGVGVHIPGIDESTEAKIIYFAALDYGDIDIETHAIGAINYDEDEGRKGNTIQYGDRIKAIGGFINAEDR